MLEVVRRLAAITVSIDIADKVETSQQLDILTVQAFTMFAQTKILSYLTYQVKLHLSPTNYRVAHGGGGGRFTNF